MPISTPYPPASLEDGGGDAQSLDAMNQNSLKMGSEVPMSTSYSPASPHVAVTVPEVPLSTTHSSESSQHSCLAGPALPFDRSAIKSRVGLCNRTAAMAGRLPLPIESIGPTFIELADVAIAAGSCLPQVAIGVPQ